jgi:hypothetical protein
LEGTETYPVRIEGSESSGDEAAAVRRPQPSPDDAPGPSTRRGPHRAARDKKKPKPATPDKEKESKNIRIGRKGAKPSPEKKRKLVSQKKIDTYFNDNGILPVSRRVFFKAKSSLAILASSPNF